AWLLDGTMRTRCTGAWRSPAIFTASTPPRTTRKRMSLERPRERHGSGSFSRCVAAPTRWTRAHPAVTPLSGGLVESGRRAGVVPQPEAPEPARQDEEHTSEPERESEPRPLQPRRHPPCG